MSHTINGADSEALRRQARSVVAALGLDGTPSAPGLIFSLLRAGFGVQTEALTGGVEVRACPEHYGPGSLLISWAPHEAAYTPLDPRVTQVESIMTDALLNTVRALGFPAERLGVSYSVLVRPGSSDAPC
ncbi:MULTISPECIES: hypothetical protein [unclassified Streptomyces]|uniref:hypothetical protein n=1 Tax=unclassified Streptomyces TaxID=2593676 RepID=UPI00104D2112